MTGSLGNKLPEDETWGANLYMNKYGCGSIPRCYRPTSETSTS